MKNLKAKYLGAAVLGVLLAGAFATDVVARSTGWLYGRTLRVASTEGRDGTVTNTLGDGDVYVQGDLEVGTKILGPVPATQTVAATFTIAADACGGIKRVTSASDVTSDTTDTFTAPAVGNKGCKMLVKNVGVHQILLDFNTKFPVGAGGAASMRLDTGGSVLVESDGTSWHFGPWTEY